MMVSMIKVSNYGRFSKGSSLVMSKVSKCCGQFNSWSVRSLLVMSTADQWSVWWVGYVRTCVVVVAGFLDRNGAVALLYSTRAVRVTCEVCEGEKICFRTSSYRKS